MASPNFDALNVRLSVLLSDPVAAYGTDGVTYSSLLRTAYLNSACSGLWDMVYYSAKKSFRMDNFKVDRFADFIVDVSPTSSASSQIDTTGTSFYVISGDSTYKHSVVEVIEMVMSVSTKRLKYIDSKEMGLLTAKDSAYTPSSQNPCAYTVRPAKQYIQILPNVTEFQSAVTRLVFLTYPQTYVTGNSKNLDIQWSPSHWDSILRLAVAYALLDDGNVQGYEAIYQSVLQRYQFDLQEQAEMAKR